ncbi:MAG: HAD family hydrolase [Gemmobacter sp.]
MIDAVIFDKDGTLFDFRRTWSDWSVRLLDELSGGNPAMAAILGQAIGFDPTRREFAPDSPVIAATPTEIGVVLLPHLPGVTLAELVERMNRLSETVPLAAAVPLGPLLEDLRRRGLRLGLVTNDAERPARMHLAAAGIAALFDFVAGFDSGHGAKPAPGPLLAFARMLGADPGRMLMIGDSPHDLIAGRAAGMRTLGVLTGIADSASLAPLAEAVLPDIGHLPPWLDGPGASAS